MLRACYKTIGYLPSCLQAETARFLALPEAKEKFNAAGGFEPWTIRTEEFSAAIRRDYDKYGKLAKDIGVRVD